MNTDELSIIPTEVSAPAEIEQNISALNAPLSGFLSHVGLPTTGLFSPIDERRKVIQAIEQVLEVLPMDERERASYISKFTVCVTVGLFDGALAYLWDETIKALRGKVISFDLEYFYSIAESLSARYRNLRDPDDISAISEHDLLEVCRRIGLIDDVNHRRLDYVNYFRNHASSAHPNNNEISGTELLGFLEVCLRHAICAPIETSVIQVKRFLENIRQHLISHADFGAIAGEIARLQPQRIDDILQTLFGMYCDPAIAQHTIENIRGLSPRIWDCVSEDCRLRIGARYGYYRSNGDVPRKERTQEFLNAVDGNTYKDEDSLGAELIEKLQHLRAAHYGANNFYNEWPHAQAIEQSLPRAGVPRSARREFVRVVTICYIGNGNGYRDGVDVSAVPYYKEFIKRFSDEDILIFCRLFADHEFTSDLQKTMARERAIGLLRVFRGHTNNVLLQRLLDVVISSPNFQTVHLSAEYKEATKRVLD